MVQFDLNKEDDIYLDRDGAIRAINPPTLAPRVKLYVTSTMI